ncbi:MAG: alpha/beta fold hydrolase BchO [Lautropia sp.]
MTLPCGANDATAFAPEPAPADPVVRDVDAGAIRWRVRVGGAGRCLLLLHGTGASGHSWRDLVPRLARHYAVVVPDLPGHGATRAHADPNASTIDGMAHALHELLAVLGLRPFAIVGHSAGAAVAARMILDTTDAGADAAAATAASPPVGLISLNGALLPMRMIGSPLMKPLARAMASSGLVARLVSRRATDGHALAKLVASTGSTLGADGVERYRRLLADPSHVAGVLAMMAHWDLASLEPDLPRLGERVLLISTDGDRTIPPVYARRTRMRMPRARAMALPSLGHLAHEEAPVRVASLILEQLREWGGHRAG